MSDNQELIEQIKKAVEPLLKLQQAELVELRYKGQPNNMILSFIVDKIGGITIDECAGLSRDIGELLDSLDIIQSRYLLEVSSPGLDSPLVTNRDFERAMFALLEINLIEPVNNKKFYTGTLIAVDECSIALEIDNGINIKIPFDKIQYTRRQIKF